MWRNRLNNAVTGRYYYLKDHLGSIRMTVDGTGTVVGYDDYYPYGMTMPGRSQVPSVADNRYKFTGKELDAETNLFYFGKRDYDGWRGGWDEVDPMFEKYPGTSPYAYVLNNPLGNIDPNGAYSYEIDGMPVDNEMAHSLQEEYEADLYNEEGSHGENVKGKSEKNKVGNGENKKTNEKGPIFFLGFGSSAAGTSFGANTNWGLVINLRNGEAEFVGSVGMSMGWGKSIGLEGSFMYTSINGFNGDNKNDGVSNPVELAFSLKNFGFGMYIDPQSFMPTGLALSVGPGYGGFINFTNQTVHSNPFNVLELNFDYSRWRR